MAMFPGISIIPPVNDAGNDARKHERAYKQAVTTALMSPEGSQAIAPYKTNGTMTGHKVGDNIDAVRALADKFKDQEQFAILSTSKINDYRKSQLLDAVIRPYAEIGKDGKLTGAPGPKMLKLQNSQTSES